ncbi:MULTISPECIES: type I restriction endonuclease subunit R [Providencia]|uniref:Type I restriction enzyme endonuclease subunit n=2 Tax=Providencia TaxID=586 RepID=A0AB35LCL4_PRORE|nr:MULTISPECIES: type I restriction endonuclease subunit R [Providencia]EKT58783.1 type I site-specific deoxyribonuclease, HsdR [Providencia rettgeri Dmel1]EMD1719427.1 type I restriction endonuclease subunit R [Providencia stuartii]MCG5378445.1 type I restriction endonuclease subunit R [Providencia rettgeri]MDH2306242.1 type I restriction endonuclease subunit R [Providencia rettgeri]WAZ74429.1 type I restriction endonuclease subunit R [Providencia stuartii]
MTKEQQIEQGLIAKLQDLKYSYRSDIRDKASLEQNFRKKFEALNRVNLSDAEFNRLREEIITADVFLAAQALREKGKFTREDGTPLEYMLVNLKDWCKNDFEVISQLRINTDNSHHRYDVILLLNGLPLVQIELKSLQISPRRAMEQIVEYKNDIGNGYTNTLLCFMQLFIVSNGNTTRYFANNRKEHFSFNADERFLPIYQHADKDNKKIANLHEFADDFLSKCTLGQLLSRYMVLVQSEQKMLVMRPYQIYAVKAIVDAIHQNRGNGYIWHTTGSGKTLTSFKASTLLKDNPDIEKCLFVVDRKDLDRQTREEFNKFQEGCVEQNTNTETLVRRMLSEDYADKVIVTTIQKLGLALDENSKRNKAQQKNGKQTYKERLEPLRDKRVIFIFDECHRSQFGENHKAIKEFFPKAQLFGFTGTPIFDENSSYQQVDGNLASFKTTEDIFEKELHAYTITHAIEDENVLSFHIDYYGKDDGKGGQTKPKKKELPPPEAVIKAILDKHDSATNQRRFNAVLATASINHAIEYFELFKTLQEQKQSEDENFEPLNIACVFSPPAQIAKENDGNGAGSVNGNKNAADIKQLQEDLPQESADNQVEPEKKKAALMAIIASYNEQYGTNHTINEFDLYYQDVQQRIKDQKYSNVDYPRKNKIDITIVVDMLLTGFDSKYLNTLYVDKNLKHHGLIQAFSRTNRVLNDTKPWGNVLDFRYQENEVNAAIELFSGGAKDKAREIWLVDPAPKVVEAFQKKVDELQTFMESKGLNCEPSQVHNLKGDTAKAEFINHFKEVQKLKTQLEQYTDLDEESKAAIEQKLPTDTLLGFKAIYLDTAMELKRKQGKSDDNEESVEQLEFDLVLFASSIIDYDYIMGLIAKSTQKTGKQKMTRQELINLISSNANLMEEREDIIAYINSLKAGEALNEKQIREGYQAFKEQKAAQALTQIAEKHGLPTQSLQAFVDSILDRMIFDGEQLTDLLAPLELSWKARRVAELALMEDLVPYLQKQAEGREISGLDAYE